MLLLLDHSEDRDDGRALRSALMSEAVRYAARDVLAVFFERGVHVYAGEEYLLLHNAVSSSNRAAAELLLEHGADISRRGPYGRTTLHMAASGAEPELLEWLLDLGADADLRTVTVNGDTPLHYAGQGSEHQLEVFRLLLNRSGGEDVNAVNNNGSTPVHRAVGSPWGDPQAIELLVDRGADISARTKKGETPLHIAARRAEPEIVATLLGRGADADLSTPSDSGDTPLHSAVKSEDPKVITLLVEAGADVSAGNDLGFTPLHLAAQYGPDLEVFRTLIGYGAQVDAQDNGGWTPLIHAACCEVRNPELRRTGGSEGVTVRNVAVVELLLRHGADVSARSHDGLTACEYVELAYEPFRLEIQPLVCP